MTSEQPRAWWRWTPWSGRATRADKAILVAALAMVAFETALKPATPFLIASHPVPLTALTGDLPPLGAAAAFARVGEAPLGIVVLAGVIGMSKFDWLMWWAGRRWGRGMVDMVTVGRHGRRWASRAWELSPRTVGVAVVLAALPGMPSTVVYAVAGWTGMRLWTFLLLDAAGTLVTTVLVAGLGYGLGQRAADGVLLVEEYASTVTLTLVLLASTPPLARGMWRSAARYTRRRHCRRAGGEDGDLPALARAEEPCPSR